MGVLGSKRKSKVIPLQEAAKLVEKKNGSEGVVIGIRPSDISLSKKKPDTDSLKAEIYTLEPRGDGMIITVKAGEELIKLDPPLENIQNMNLTPGDECWLIPDKEKIYIFDKSAKLNENSFS